MTDALHRMADDRRKAEVRVVRQALLSFSDQPVIGEAAATIAWRATDEQLLAIGRRIR